MRIFEIHGARVDEHPTLAPLARPGACQGGYLWLSLTRSELRAELARVQPVLEALCGTQLLDLHVSDLLNDQLPSHYDYTSLYDVLVLRRLAAGALAAQDARPPRMDGNTIRVTATGEARMPADRAWADFGVDTEATTAREAAAEKVRDAGLPESLALRLRRGR